MAVPLADGSDVLGAEGAAEVTFLVTPTGRKP